jgi:hypothetical protein
MGKGVKGLDAQSGAPPKSAVAEFADREPPSLRSKARLGVCSDLHSFGNG